MKKIIVFLCGLLCMSAIASAQHISTGIQIGTAPEFYADYYGPYFLDNRSALHKWGPILYGREYTKASNQLTWGKTLGILGITFALSSALCFGNEVETGLALLGTGAIFCGVGIPLWVKGQKKMNVMEDDFSKRARDYMGISMNLTVGPTRNGVGLALNF